MSEQITQILDRIVSGQEHAFDELVPLVYEPMKQIAAAALSKEARQAYDPTELVHEAYMRLIGNEQLAWSSRRHFFAACAVMIRRILVDQARARQRQKRGGDFQEVNVEIAQLASAAGGIDLVMLDDALVDLHQRAPRQAKLVELRFFGGMTEQEVADHLQISKRTAANDWATARAWLKSKIER